MQYILTDITFKNIFATANTSFMTYAEEDQYQAISFKRTESLSCSNIYINKMEIV